MIKAHRMMDRMKWWVIVKIVFAVILLILCTVARWVTSMCNKTPVEVDSLVNLALVFRVDVLETVADVLMLMC